ncbi:MAG: type 2 isopentenyl-diphosphate Delta-isomerase [Polyangiaceae bacterium]|nr:type 2 isopentenyl-diphosphate Delta-isomerase [Polyangiaceae bacterium]
MNQQFGRLCAMSELGSRKGDHIDLAISGNVGFRKGTLLDEVQLIHCSLPELHVDKIELATDFLGCRLSAPLLIAAMTGGTERAGLLNLKLAEVAEQAGVALGLGSQRAMVKTGEVNQEIAASYRLRQVAPSIPILGNLGAVQAAEMSTSLVSEMLDAVQASALCIHLNPAQEMIQPGGDRDFRGCEDAIARLADELKLPVIAKETGCGISASVGHRLKKLGVQHVDISGGGGTSWVGVEARRAHGDKVRQGEEFWDWGIPTAASILQLAPLQFQTLIATGGIKSGLDVARALNLGANLAGIARPVLQALDAGGQEGAISFIEAVADDLRAAMLLTGSGSVKALQEKPRLIGPNLQVWKAPL